MIKFVMASLMWLYLLILLIAWGSIYFDTGHSWWVTLFLFSPRWVLGLPWLLLFPLTMLFDFRTARWYMLHLLILVVPIFGFCVPSFDFGEKAEDSGVQLRVMTCNVGEGPIRVAQLLALLKQEKIDVLLLQECNSQLYDELQHALDWSFRHDSKLVIASPRTLSDLIVVERRVFPHYSLAEMIAVQLPLQASPQSIGASAGQADEKEFASQLSPANAEPSEVRIVCAHFPTFRPAFEKARNFDASADEEYRIVADEYRHTAKQAYDGLQAVQTPTLIAGDFNVPIESAFYRDYWSDYQNALSLKGWGLCYTKYTRMHGVRIDHLLADANWTVQSAKVGPDLGGDHRPVSVVLSLNSNAN